MNKAIAWASCYLDPTDQTYQALSAVGESLRAAGMEMVLFGPYGDYSRYTGFHHVGFPHLLGEYGRVLSPALAESTALFHNLALDEMVSIDRVLGSAIPDDEHRGYVSRVMTFWERMFDIMRPSVVLGWGTIAPFARLMVRLAQRRQVPAYVLERGLLEDTLSLSLGGQVALSSVTTSPALIRPPEMDGGRTASWHKIESYYRGLQGRRYADQNRAPTADEQAVLRTDPSPRVLFIGSGCSYAHPVFGECIDTWNKTSEEAAYRLAEGLHAVAPGASLWAKAHPLIPFALSPKAGPAVVRNASDIDVHKLVEAADIVVTLTSMAQALAFIYDRPLVTLSNGFFMGRDIAYEVTSAEELVPALRIAITKTGWDKRLAAGRSLLVSMMEHDLFGLNKSVPTRLKMDDMATLLGRFTRYVKAGSAPAESRIKDFLNFRASAEKPT